MDAGEELDRLRRRLERERRARLEAETLGERATSALYETVAALQLSKAVLDETPDLVAMASADGSVTYLNRAFCAALGAEPDTVPNVVLWDLLASASREARLDEILAALADVGVWRGELVLALPGTAELSVSQVFVAHRDATTRVRTISSISRDISERLAIEARLAEQALHDALTGLPNRLLLLDRIDQAMARARREKDLVAVLFLDLDRFKLINDGLGHAAGDRLLHTVARRISATLRACDTVGRLGGDEFLVVCESIGSEDNARTLATRIETSLAEPYTLGDDEVFVTASVGICLGSGVETGAELIRRADEAMYDAKQRGRGRFEVFHEALRIEASERLQTQNELHRALDGAELRLHYQPIIGLADGHIFGVEALLRWQHPRRGLLSPGAFIGLAEETGQITDIGAWVLTEACHQVARWRATCEHLEQVTVAVNLSAHQLSRPGFAAFVAETLRTAGLPPDGLCLELTESILMDTDGPVLSELKAVKDLGIALGTDDFGTGYSSLHYLKSFPIDFLKIDRTFISGIGTDPTDTAISEALVCLGSSLGLRVIAEGVETLGQLEHLQSLGCPYAQGFYLARPQPPENIAALDPQALIRAAGIP